MICYISGALSHDWHSPGFILYHPCSTLTVSSLPCIILALICIYSVCRCVYECAVHYCACILKSLGSRGRWWSFQQVSCKNDKWFHFTVIWFSQKLIYQNNNNNLHVCDVKKTKLQRCENLNISATCASASEYLLHIRLCLSLTFHFSCQVGHQMVTVRQCWWLWQLRPCGVTLISKLAHEGRPNDVWSRHATQRACT